MDEKYNLTWHTYMLHGKEMFRDLMETKRFSDLTLVSDDQYQYKVHRFLLGASSSVFKSILENNPQNTLIYLRGIQHEELELILQFIYLGKATFYQERMKEFLDAADDLNIIGIRDAQLNEESFFINEIKPNAALLGEENIRDEKEINYVEKPLTKEEKAKIDEIDCVQRPALVELSTADMSNPTLARIDCFVIARCPKEIAVGQQTFTFFKSPQNCRIGESSH